MPTRPHRPLHWTPPERLNTSQTPLTVYHPRRSIFYHHPSPPTLPAPFTQSPAHSPPNRTSLDTTAPSAMPPAIEHLPGASPSPTTSTLYSISGSCEKNRVYFLLHRSPACPLVSSAARSVSRHRPVRPRCSFSRFLSPPCLLPANGQHHRFRRPLFHRPSTFLNFQYARPSRQSEFSHILRISGALPCAPTVRPSAEPSSPLHEW